MNSNSKLGAYLEDSMVYEVIVELAGEIFVMERSMCLNKQNQVNIAYTNEFVKK